MLAEQARMILYPPVGVIRQHLVLLPLAGATAGGMATPALPPSMERTVVLVVVWDAATAVLVLELLAKVTMAVWDIRQSKRAVAVVVLVLLEVMPRVHR